MLLCRIMSAKLVDFGHVDEAGVGEALFELGAVHVLGGAELVERRIFVAQFHVDHAQKHEGVGG